jgi:RNA polymerase sigma-32 factor
MKLEPLSLDQEISLWNKWTGDRCIRSRDRISAQAMPIADLKAREYSQAYGVEREELISCGYLGIAEALKRFDIDRGVRFATYADWWIEAKIMQFVERTCNGQINTSTTANRRRAFWKMSEAIRATGCEDAEKIAEYLGLPIGDVEAVLERRKARDLELNEPDGHSRNNGNTNSDRADHFPDPATDPEADLEQADLESDRRSRLPAAIAALAKLDRRLAYVVRERFLRETPRSLAEIGARLGIGRQRAGQLEQEGVDRLRSLMAGGDEYIGAREVAGILGIKPFKLYSSIRLARKAGKVHVLEKMSTRRNGLRKMWWNRADVEIFAERRRSCGRDARGGGGVMWWVSYRSRSEWMTMSFRDIGFANHAAAHARTFAYDVEVTWTGEI